MARDMEELAILRQQVEKRRNIEFLLTRQFAREDEALQVALNAAKQQGLPQIQISPLQGKFLQFLATACRAQRILEI
jgi:caffeoyl-CoA O-methyltransferase